MVDKTTKLRRFPKLEVTQNGCVVLENPIQMDENWGYRGLHTNYRT